MLPGEALQQGCLIACQLQVKFGLSNGFSMPKNKMK